MSFALFLPFVPPTFLADTDKKFPVIGFGGKLGPDQPANHAFAVNFNEQNNEVDGMAGVLQVRERERELPSG